eukprot:Sspe_Gene.36788::Locus_17772_Transcript_1_1_Confidence_1.000_Length_442::g.36788::m.36788
MILYPPPSPQPAALRGGHQWGAPDVVGVGSDGTGGEYGQGQRDMRWTQRTGDGSAGEQCSASDKRTWTHITNKTSQLEKGCFPQPAVFMMSDLPPPPPPP